MKHQKIVITELRRIQILYQSCLRASTRSIGPKSYMSPAPDEICLITQTGDISWQLKLSPNSADLPIIECCTTTPPSFSLDQQKLTQESIVFNQGCTTPAPYFLLMPKNFSQPPNQPFLQQISFHLSDQSSFLLLQLKLFLSWNFCLFLVATKLFNLYSMSPNWAKFWVTHFQKLEILW